MAPGSRSVIRFENDFTGLPHAHIPAAEGDVLGGGVGLIGVNEGSYVGTVDEPGGIIAITTDTADNDNHALWAGVFKPADGGMWMECRLKLADVAATNQACFVGFTETLAKDTPVMPAETATATTTYNGTGGMAGFVFDSDSTALVWRYVVGDGGAALATVTDTGAAGTAVGITASRQTVTADRWYVFRVEITPKGIARGYIGDIGSGDQLRFVGENTTALGTGDSFHAVAMLENRAGAAEVFEVDYFEGEGYRDWAAD